MAWPDGKEDERRLDALFQAYRLTCGEPEPSPGFMPRLWQRIEARRRTSLFMGRLTGGFVTAAAALSLAMAVYLYTPSNNVAFFSQSYVEALEEQHAAENADFFEPVHYLPADSDNGTDTL